MSTTPTTQTPDPYQEARVLLNSEIWQPSYFAKLASLGIRPQNQAEAEQLLLMSEKVRLMDTTTTNKMATDRLGWLQDVNNVLDQTLQTSGILVESQLKTAAQELTKIPQLHDAALLFYDALNRMAA